MKMRKKISIVIPTYNEEANVVPLSKAVIEVMERDLSEYDYEILFIDNHSKDNTHCFAACVQIIKKSRRFLMRRISDRHVHRYME